jgi:hypothetical protein
LTRIGSKGLRWVKVLILGVSLLKRFRRVALSFLRTRRGRSLVWVEHFLYFLHVLWKLLPGFSFLVKSCFHGMVRATHAKQEPRRLLDGRTRLLTLLIGFYRSDRLSLPIRLVLQPLAAVEELGLVLEESCPELVGSEASLWDLFSEAYETHP